MSLIPPPFDPAALNAPGAVPSLRIGAGAGVGETYPSLRAYWRVLANRCWTIATVACVVVTLVLIVSFKMHPVYQAISRVEIEAEMPSLQSLRDLYQTTPSDDAFLDTQVDVLKSDSLAWKTIQQTHLQTKAEFSHDLDGLKPAEAGARLAARTRLLRAFRKHLQVDRMGDSRMVEIKFESTNTQLAAQVANALVRNYMDYNFRKNYDSTREASARMEQRLGELKERVEKSQQALVDYERRNAIVNVDGKQNIVDQRLADLSKELTNAESDRLQKESLYETIRSGQWQAPLVPADELLDKLQERDAELESQYTGALEQYGPKFPKVLRLRDQVRQAQGFITSERKHVKERIGDEYQAALDRENLLAAAVARQKIAVGKLNQLLIQHNLLKGEFETNQQLYDRLLQHLKDATVSAGLKSTNIHIVDAALPPSLPVRPKKLLYAGVALFAGIFLGIIFAFTEEALDNSITGMEEVERLTGVPTLAVIPSAHWAHSHPYPGARNGHSRIGSNGAVELSVAREPNSPLAESFRNLRTAILLSTAPRPPQIILVTSTQPLEGKTSTSLNLALALAQRGMRTLIIDADLRKRAICAAVGMRSRSGLSSILTGAHGLEEALHQADGLPGLSVLPAGPRPPNPAELLSSAAMEKLLNDLRQRFDFLVLDSPPLLPVTDATVLSAVVDGVVLVVECRVTDRGALARAHAMLDNAGANILGTVLNKIEPHHDGYYRSSYRAYYASHHDHGAAAGQQAPVTSQKV